jgi:hypothetical protein
VNELLSQPALQSSLIPFCAALAMAVLLLAGARRWAGLAVLVGFYAAVYLIAGFEFAPLTSTRKILLLGLAAIPVALVLDALRKKARVGSSALFWLAGAALLWVVWPVVQREELRAALALGGMGAIYAVLVTSFASDLAAKPRHAGVALLTMSLGTGGAALMGASALIGQLGLALGAATGAWLLLAMWKPAMGAGNTLTLPVGFLNALLGYSAFVYARLPWFALLPLGLIPLVARFVAPDTKVASWRQTLWLVLLASPLAALAVFLAWWVEGAPPL